MRRLIVGGAIVGLGLLTGACDQLKERLGGAASKESAPSSALPKVCEDFLTQYSCFLKKTTNKTDEADKMRKDFESMPAAVRSGLQDTCTKQLALQATAFQGAGCGAGVAAAPTASASSASTAASAVPTTTAKPTAAPTASTPTPKKANVPTCKAGEALVTLAASPFYPVCVTKCNSDADCKVESCQDLSNVDSNTGKFGTGTTKGCNPEYPKPINCPAGQHFDDFSRNCRPLGDCAGTSFRRWDEAKKKCVNK